MRITEQTRFPHPVLGLETGDFTAGSFDVSFETTEDPNTGSLSIKHEVTLTEENIKHLVESNMAKIGCFVKCGDTFYSELKELAWPSGRTDFPPGALLNRVMLRPLIYMNKGIAGWDPGTIHHEFSPPVSLFKGDIIAIGDEFIISVGQAKFAPLESIFELVKSPEIDEGKLQVELERDRVTILAAPQTFDTICLLREQMQGRPVVMNSVYLPAVMEVLDSLHEGKDQYEPFRWYTPFLAKCDAKGIDPSSGHSILENAQILLDQPINQLVNLVSGDE